MSESKTFHESDLPHFLTILENLLEYEQGVDFSVYQYADSVRFRSRNTDLILTIDTIIQAINNNMAARNEYVSEQPFRELTAEESSIIDNLLV